MLGVVRTAQRLAESKKLCEPSFKHKYYVQALIFIAFDAGQLKIDGRIWPVGRSLDTPGLNYP